MRFQSINVALLALAAGAAAETIKVSVGKGGKKFSPNTIEAAVGDIVEFNVNGQHSVVASDFDSPCEPAADGGFFSGVSKSISVMIENTDPIFVYCSVGDHCQDGMVAVINEGSDTLDSYKSAASDASDNVSPDSPFGGAESDESEDGEDEDDDNAAGHLTASRAAVAGLVVFAAGLLAL